MQHTHWFTVYGVCYDVCNIGVLIPDCAGACPLRDLKLFVEDKSFHQQDIYDEKKGNGGEGLDRDYLADAIAIADRHDKHHIYRRP